MPIDHSAFSPKPAEWRFRVPSVVALTSFVFAMSGAAIAGDLSPVGRWETIDDTNGKPGGVIEIAEKGGTLEGRLVQLYSPAPADNPGRLCWKCDGDLKDKPVIGMTIMSGLKRDGDVWEDGTILDPESGDTYSARLKVMDGGRKLEVRGYLGISLFGRSQIWVREAALK